MPITAYLSKRRPEIRVPRTHTNGFDPLTGQFSVQDAAQHDAEQALQWRNKRTLCSPNDYDPILKHHLKVR
jgi:hypothetical protein